MKINKFSFLFLGAIILLFTQVPNLAATTKSCTPTTPDAMGPFYEPNSPVKNKVGEGYVLKGVVLSSATCAPVAGAQIELWLAGPDGRYDNEHRATVYSDKSGAYTFESNFPPSYFNRPPHIHIRVTAEGYLPLVTQHYPETGQTSGNFDLVLIPAQ